VQEQFNCWPAGQEPSGWNKSRGHTLSDMNIVRCYERSAVPPLGSTESDHDEDFRISIAGAQEKAALLSMGGAWFPRWSNANHTHIKLPWAIIGNFRGGLLRLNRK